MEGYKTVKNKTFTGIIPDTKMIYFNCDISDFHLEKSTTLEECIFIHCHFRSIRIINFLQFIQLTFLNCRISGLHIEESNIPNLRFFKSEINGARFQYSNLPGIVLSKNAPNGILRIQNKLIQGEKEKDETFMLAEIDALLLYRTEFLFCHLNDMHIDNTVFKETKLKHCTIQDMRISGNVEMSDIDFRGSNLLDSDFSECRFGSVKFNKSKYFLEIIGLLFTFPYRKTIKIKYKKICNSKREFDRLVFTKLVKMRTNIKRFMYKLKLPTFADLLSSVECQNVRYKDAENFEDYNFLWHIQELNFIYKFKMNHPIFAQITFWFSNYMRSFPALLAFSFLVVWLFSLLYETDRVLFSVWSFAGYGEIPDVDTLYLSFKIFTNFGMDPIEAENFFTKFLTISEIVIGYFSLGSLLSIIIFPFTRMISLPGGSNKRE